MSMDKGVIISGTGSYLPERVMTNHDLEEMVDTSDEWITTRSGIQERRIAAPEEATSDLAYGAAKRALEAADKNADDVDLIIVATLFPDCPFPNTGCFLQRKIGAKHAACFSLEAACSGFLYALEVGASLVKGGPYKTALVVGAEKMSAVLDWTDRSTCVLFGDGAGAVVIEETAPENNCYLGATLGADGNYTDLLYVPAGGSLQPSTQETVKNRMNYLKMNGREIFKLAVNAMVGAANGALEQAGVAKEQLRWLVPHQANTRIIKSVGKRLELNEERVFMNLDRYGNTSAASIPIALDEIVRSGRLARDDYLLLVAFGGGLTWGASVLKWQ